MFSSDIIKDDSDQERSARGPASWTAVYDFDDGLKEEDDDLHSAGLNLAIQASKDPESFSTSRRTSISTSKNSGQSTHQVAPAADETQYHEYRPNRFYGPISTWYSCTESERQTIKALDQERTEDLSAHLYVAHRIKREANSQHGRSRSGGRRGRRNGQGMGTAAADPPNGGGGGGRSNVEQAFVPPKTWTAWPMPPHQVPRTFHTTGMLDETDPLTMRKTPDLRPSAELEECIIATATRLARERWSKKAWESGENSSSLFSADKKADECLDLVSGASDQRDDGGPRRFFLSSEPVSQAPSLPAVSSPGSRSVDASANAEIPNSTRPISRSPSPLYFLPPTASLRPVPIADEDRARSLLLPSTRRIIEKVDELLLGLHTLRQSYGQQALQARRPQGHTKSQRQPPSESEDASSSSSRRPNDRQRPTTTATSTTRTTTKTTTQSSSTLKQQVPDDEDDDGDDSSSHATSNIETNALPSNHQDHRSTSRLSKTGRTKSKQRSGIKNQTNTTPTRLALDDWSQVLGIAALIGWDRDVLARAGERCASLFGQDMRFRDFCEVEEVKGGGGGYGGASRRRGRGVVGKGKRKRKGKGSVSMFEEEWVASGRVFGGGGGDDGGGGEDDEEEDVEDEDEDEDEDEEEQGKN